MHMSQTRPCTTGPLLRSVSTKKRKHSSIQDRGTEGQRRPGGCVWLWADSPRRSPDSPGLPPQPRGASSSVGCVRGTGPPGLGRTRPRERGGKQGQPQSRRRGAMKVVGRREAWAGQWLGQSRPGARSRPARPCGRCGVTRGRHTRRVGGASGDASSRCCRGAGGVILSLVSRGPNIQTVSLMPRRRPDTHTAPHMPRQAPQRPRGWTSADKS